MGCWLYFRSLMLDPTAPLIVIPARRAATRLPDKPLAHIAGVPMIVHVLNRAKAAEVGRVVVATPDKAILDVVRDAGGEAVLTRPDHPSGTDRVVEALHALDPDGRAGIVVNLQGDMPSLPPEALRQVIELVETTGCDLATLALATDDAVERADPSVVKAVISFAAVDATHGRAVYFTRSPAPSGAGPLYHHIGLYAFRRAALLRFAQLEPTLLEQRERLEQLRALEAGMHIAVGLTASRLITVDTPQDLARVRALFAVGVPM